MLILFNVGEWTRDGLRSVEARYGDLARLDAWLERLDARETEPGTMPPVGAWEVADGWRRPLGAIGVIELVTGVSPVGRVEGPALSDLDGRGVCRCGCMAGREELVWFNARAAMGVASW